MKIKLIIALLSMLILILGLNSSAQIDDVSLPCLVASGFNAFLKIDGIEGESADEKHMGWIDVLSYSHGMSQRDASSGSVGAGAGAGRVSHQDFTIVKNLDKSSPLLYLAVNTGQRFKDVKLELVRAGGDKQKYMEIKMSDAMITSVQYSGSRSESSPTESVSFNYAKIEWTYTPFDNEGRAQGDIKTFWDVKTEKKT